MPTAEVNGARLWYDEAGDGPALLLLHGGLGDSELWEPVVPFLAERYRTIRTDLRFFGRSTGPPAPWSWHDDVVALLDELEVERTALVGLSVGGRIAYDIALDHPERLWALACVAPGLGAAPQTEAQEAAYAAAEAEGDLETMMEVDLSIWAPLGADERIRRLWHATPDANPLPAGIEPRLPYDGDPKERLPELDVPTLIVTLALDPPGFRAAGPAVAERAPNARHVELDSDHYVTLREPELLSGALLEFLAATAPQK
jgi:3-oxoadipate enol-lactonase